MWILLPFTILLPRCVIISTSLHKPSSSLPVAHNWQRDKKTRRQKHRSGKDYNWERMHKISHILFYLFRMIFSSLWFYRATHALEPTAKCYGDALTNQPLLGVVIFPNRATFSLPPLHALYVLRSFSSLMLTTVCTLILILCIELPVNTANLISILTVKMDKTKFQAHLNVLWKRVETTLMISCQN